MTGRVRLLPSLSIWAGLLPGCNDISYPYRFHVGFLSFSESLFVFISPHARHRDAEGLIFYRRGFFCLLSAFFLLVSTPNVRGN